MSVSIMNSVSGGGGISSDEVTAIAGDVLKGKTYLGNDTNDGIGTGTLELTGDVTENDVMKGKTFYSTDAKTKKTGTMEIAIHLFKIYNNMDAGKEYEEYLSTVYLNSALIIYTRWVKDLKIYNYNNELLASKSYTFEESQALNGQMFRYDNLSSPALNIKIKFTVHEKAAPAGLTRASIEAFSTKRNI